MGGSQWVGYMTEDNKALAKASKTRDEFLRSGKKFWRNETSLIKPISAVRWVKNDETGEMAVFTRGEYATDLINFINNLK